MKVRRVLLFSRYSLVRSGLKYILSHANSNGRSGRFFFEETKNLKDVVRKIGKEAWDIVILDFSLEGHMVLGHIKQLTEKDKISVLIISPYIEDQNLKRSLSAGASGCLHWENIEQHLVKAIDQIGRGERYVDPKMSSLFLSEEQNLPHDCLSDREFQVLCQLSQGKRVVDAAKEIALSPKTVHTYRKRIQEKMRLKEPLIKFCFSEFCHSVCFFSVLNG